MSEAVCDCGRISHPFGQGGGAALSEQMGTPLLGRVPFEESTGVDGDAGAPATWARADGPTAACFRHLARGVREALGMPRLATADSASMP